MPIYTFINKETKVVTEHVMKIAELDPFKENNPHLERYLNSMVPIGDPVRLGLVKVPNGFRDVLARIHSRSPGSVLKDNIR